MNNNLLFNAGVIGFVNGALEGRVSTDDNQNDYAAIYSAAESYGSSIDSLISFDATISGAGGVTLPPTTAAITANQAAKVNLVTSLSAAIFAGRYNVNATSAFYAEQAAAVYAQYVEGVAFFGTAGTLD
jgi:hypothetical protein